MALKDLIALSLNEMVVENEKKKTKLKWTELSMNGIFKTNNEKK